MKTIWLLLNWLFVSMSGPDVPTRPGREVRMSDPTRIGTTPRLTTDKDGNPLLSWVEKETDKQAAFYFAFAKESRAETPGPLFGPKIRVNAPATLSVHAEGMPKLAQKADGTLLALFEVPRPTPESRFAGDLLYVTSTDNGQTWTEPKPLHRNRQAGSSHSFSDLTRLPNGEIGIAWLDEKLPGHEGRPVRFVQTRPDGSFTDEITVDENACQCCRTNVFVDNKQRIHLTYRDMGSARPGEIAARDIGHVVSDDATGHTFSQPAVVVADDWRVNACPHAGPSVAQVGDDVFVTWFSGKENAVGLRLARPGDSKPVATVLSTRAKHPQIASLNRKLIWVWDEAIRKPGQSDSEPMPQYVQRIALRTSPNGPSVFITPDDENATYPVILPTKSGLLMAYEAKKGDDSKTNIVYQFVDLP